LLSIQPEAAFRNRNITRRGIASFQQVQIGSGGDPELEDDCQMKDEKHAGQPVVKVGRGGFDFICKHRLPGGPEDPKDLRPLNRDNNILWLRQKLKDTPHHVVNRADLFGAN